MTARLQRLTCLAMGAGSIAIAAALLAGCTPPPARFHTVGVLVAGHRSALRLLASRVAAGVRAMEEARARIATSAEPLSSRKGAHHRRIHRFQSQLAEIDGYEPVWVFKESFENWGS